MLKRRIIKTMPVPTSLTVHYNGESQYVTLAITDPTVQKENDGMPMPAIDDIHHAKQWVDFNEK